MTKLSVDAQVIHPAMLFSRKPGLPVLHNLRADIYGRRPERYADQETPDALVHLDEVVTEYQQNNIPFVVFNMGIPKSGKTALAGEQLAYVARRLDSNRLRTERKEGLKSELAYIPYESVQRLVEREGKVPPGHGPGKQTLADHGISSKRMVQEIVSSLTSGQNIIAEAPCFAGRFEFEDLSALVTHTGPFAGLKYNVKVFWPIPDGRHQAYTMMARMPTNLPEGDITNRVNPAILVHTDDSSQVVMPGANEVALRSNFYPELVRHLRQLYTGLSQMSQTIKSYHFMFDSSYSIPTFSMNRFLKDAAPILCRLLRIPERDALVGVNSLLMGNKKAEHYDGLLRYFDRCKR